MKQICFQAKRLHAHHLISAIDIEHLACDRRRAVAGEEGAGGTQLFGQHIALERRMRFVMFKHATKTRDATRG